MVYVDDATHKFHRMIMCHMIADTEEELHEMANKIGMKRSWFQNNSDHPHYDLSKSRRQLAVQFGATEITQKQLVEIIRTKRKNDVHTF